MADEENRDTELLDHLNTFLSGCGDPKSSQSMSSIDKIQCAIVLLQSLPCARHAVLEQLCGAFHESMHKFMIEMERKAQLGGTGSIPEVVDADLDNALHSICDVVSNFVNTNPSSWALLICEWCLNLLGDLISKFDQKRGVSLTLSFSEGFHKWMSFPPVQMLMGIGTLCCSKLVVSNPDHCMETLLQMSIKYSPHLDWVVAHIVSHFHDIIVKKLLSTALRDYANTLGDESDEKSVLVSTVVQVLGYLSIQFAAEIKSHLLALFHASLSQDKVDEKEKKEQLATVPFLLHIASLSPELLKETLSEFVDDLSQTMLVQLYGQSVSRSTLYNKPSSLIPALVDIITNIGTGAYDIFRFLLDNCCPDSKKDETEVSTPHLEVQKTCIYIMESLLLKLQEVTSHRHKLYTQKATIAPLVTTCTESAFLLEMSSSSIKLTRVLLQTEGKRLGWMFRMLVLMCVHSGETKAVQILNYLLIHSKSNESLNLFVQMQCELEFYYHNVLQETIKKCMMSMNHSSAVAKPNMVKNILDNLHQLIVAERAGHFPPRCQLVDVLQDHYIHLSSLISHSNHTIASKTMSLILTYNQTTYPTAAAKGSICRTVISFLFEQLRELGEVKPCFTDVIDRIKLCTQMLNKLSQDEDCRLLLIRILVESTLEKENIPLFGGKSQGKAQNNLSQSHPASLLEYNQNPHISSRLALSPSSLFFTGVIGNKNRNGLPKKDEDKPNKYVQTWLPSSQVYMDTLTTLCTSSRDTGPSGEEGVVVVTSNTDHVALLLMEMLCPEMVLYNGEWPDDETLKFTVERDLKIRKTFDENPILWWLLVLVSQGVSSLCKCAPLTSSLLATVMSSWEACRDNTVAQSSELFRDTQYIMQVMVEANWLPAPLSRVGGVLHLLSPKEIFAITSTMWKVLKEYPPQPSPPKDEQRWKQGSVIAQKEVIKAIFINNISTLGQHYARVFQNT